MKLARLLTTSVALAALLLGAPAFASGDTHGDAPGEGHGAAGEETPYADVMMHHITNGYDVEVPAPNGHLGHKIDLRETFGTWSFQLGETTIDMTPSKLVLFLWLSAFILFVLYGVIAPRKYDERGVPRGFGNLLEVLVIFVRDEIAIANIGKKDGPRYVPFLLTLFLFILVMNFVGLIPYMSTATSNLAVTGALALIAFFMTTLAGMRAHGTLGYWKALVPSGVPAALWPLMWPIEFVGLFTKPFALTVRLFANMTAGHVVILSLLGLIFVQKSLVWVPVSVPFALFIYLLEILVALLQAYIFAMLTALFIGLASHDH
ncbi:MAG: F0F1 ATP synthase subunit A [Deltaproteobacteria bacterium]|nr:F0F1 ATP synthase subunit A [Deltaproteobacteria bacterium]